MDDELKLKGGSGFSGMDSRKVGFSRDNDTGFASKETPVYGPRVREPEETLHIRRREPGDASSALWPTLNGNPTDGYKLAMNLGHVDARKHVGDAALPLAITDIPGQPDPIANGLAVADGDKIYCKITENDQGVATAAVIEKAAAWPVSVSPGLIGGEVTAGTNGTRNIRLCEVVTVDGLLRLKIYHTGNIAHFQPELVENAQSPSAAGLGARILRQWVTTAGHWKLRMLSRGLGRNTITEFGDEAEIRGTKLDSDVIVFYGATASEDPLLGFRDGYETTGTEVIGDEAEPPQPAEKVIQIPEVIADPDGELEVTPIAGAFTGTERFEIRGNSNDATFTISVNGGSPVTLLECKDGLVPTATTNIDITIPDPGGGGDLPDGIYTGDLLYWDTEAGDGGAWVVLEAPEEPGADEEIFIRHPGRGFAPEYLTVEKLEVNICIDGDPDNPYIIYGKPNPPP